MLEVQSLRAGYGQMEVLRGIDVSLSRGEIVAVLGANGAGKSTLNNALSGVVRPTGGTILFDGQNITGTRPRDIIAQGLIHVPEGRKIFPNLSVIENLMLGGYRRGRDRRPQNIDRAYEIFPRLAERQGQLAGTLSGGEQQMLAIGRGLMGEPKLLILDEPSLGLSPLLVEEMFALIQRLNAEGLTILLVEQNVAQSLEIADRAYVLENGVVAMQGSATELMDSPDLQRSYLGI
ncbi:MAG: ABC transporter ATP-binding protein [Pseudomonadota bacterium]